MLFYESDHETFPCMEAEQFNATHSDRYYLGIDIGYNDAGVQCHFHVGRFVRWCT